MIEEKKMKITFVPGCFDDFDGTQEELDALVAEIQSLADSGELLEKAISIDEADIDDLELQDVMEDMVKTFIQSDTRTLH